MLHDPIEDNPKIKSIIDAADRETNTELKNSQFRDQMGFCHVFWSTKKGILKEKYGIEWKTPAEMNPFVIFD